MIFPPFSPQISGEYPPARLDRARSSFSSDIDGFSSFLFSSDRYGPPLSEIPSLKGPIPPYAQHAPLFLSYYTAFFISDVLFLFWTTTALFTKPTPEDGELSFPF